jgi:hypothetical protein
MSGSMTGGIDSSIPLQAGKGVQQPNPLQMIGEFAQAKNALNNLQLFSGQQQLQQQAIQGGQVNLANLQNASAYRAMTPLLAGGPITHDSLTTALGSIESNLGLPTHQIINDVLATGGGGDGPQFDAKVRALIASRSQTSPESAVAMATPRQGMVDYGPGIQPVNIAPPGSPNVGQVTPVGGAFTKGVGPQYVQTGAGNVPTNNGQPTGPVIPNAPSPGDQNQLVQTWNPNTKQFDYTPRLNVAPMVNGVGQPVAGGAAPVPGLPQNGRIQPPQANVAPMGNGAGQPVGGSAAPGPGMPTNGRSQPPQAPAMPPANAAASPPLGTQQEAEAAAVHAGAARERANNYQSTIFPIEGALTSLQGADTGKGGEVLNTIRSYLGDTPLKYVSDFVPSTFSDQDKRTLYDEAQKYTTGMAIGGPGGSRSDAGNQASAAANPNVHISNAAAVAVTKSILAQRRMDQTGTLAFNNSGLPANQYDQFMNSWNTQQDPRAYAIDKMDPTDRANMAQSLGGKNTAAYQRFKGSVQAAIDAGVIPNPSGASQ